MIESLFGSLLGGIFRLIPEFIKLTDTKDARKHELAMMDIEVKLATMRAEQAMHIVDTQAQTTQFDAIGKALEGQATMAAAGGKFVSALSALVRPMVTYWFVIFYSAVKIASMQMAYEQNANWKLVLTQSWTTDDMAILSMILTFWFIGRAVEKWQSK